MDEQKHSRLGIAAFIIGITAAILNFDFMFTGVIPLPGTYGLHYFYIKMRWLIFYGFLFLSLSLIALGLGIGGLVQKERKKLFAILGTIFSALPIISRAVMLLWSLFTGRGQGS
jgi:hypothetical protein